MQFEFSNKFDNTTVKVGDVEWSPTPTPQLILELWPNLDRRNPGFPFQQTSFSCLISQEYK